MIKYVLEKDTSARGCGVPGSGKCYTSWIILPEGKIMLHYPQNAVACGNHDLYETRHLTPEEEKVIHLDWISTGEYSTDILSKMDGSIGTKIGEVRGCVFYRCEPIIVDYNQMKIELWKPNRVGDWRMGGNWTIEINWQRHTLSACPDNAISIYENLVRDGVLTFISTPEPYNSDEMKCYDLMNSVLLEVDEIRKEHEFRYSGNGKWIGTFSEKGWGLLESFILKISELMRL